MNATIENINIQIREKGLRLKQKSEMKLKAIRLHQGNVPTSRSEQFGNNVLSNTLFALAGLTAVTTVIAPYKPVSLVICACAVCGGLRIRNSKNSARQPFRRINMQEIDQLTSQMLDVVKSIKDDWDTFMEQKKAIVQNVIKSIDVDEEKRSLLYKNSYVTESIQFAVADVISEMNRLAESNDATAFFSTIKDNLCQGLDKAINIAVDNQTKKYKMIDSLMV